MKCASCSLAAGFGLLALMLMTGCFSQSDLSGKYTTPTHARSTEGPGWQGSAEILLTQVGSSLTGHVTLHHPTAGTVQIPITSGSVQGGHVVFFGHTTLPLGTVDLKFTGLLKTNCIEGRAALELDSLFGEEHDNANWQLAKA